jgi:hypothetical protein
MSDRRMLSFAAGGSFAIYCGFLVLQPVLRLTNLRLLGLTPWTRRFARGYPELSEPWAQIFTWLQQPPVRTTLYVVALFVLFALYLSAYRSVRAGAHVSRRTILLVFLLFAVVLVPSLPTFSADVFSYVAHGELVDTRGLSPYEVRMEDHRDLEMARYATRMRLGSVYGPLALRTFQALHVTSLGPFANLMVLKIFFLLLLVASLDLVFRTAQALGCPPMEARARLLLLAWNPLVLLEGVLDAHVDVLILFLVALGTFLVVRGRTAAGLAVLTASAAVKIVFLFLVPLVLVYAFHSARPAGRSAGVRRAALVLVAGAALNLVWYLPDWVGGGPLTALAELRNYASGSVTFILRRVLRVFGVRGTTLPLFTSGIFAAIVLFRIWRVRDLPGFLARLSRDVLLWLLVFVSVTHPWYALPLFPAVLAAGVRRHVAALLLFSLSSLFAFYGLRMVTGMFTEAAKFVDFFGGVLPPALVLLFGTRVLPARCRAWVSVRPC